MPKTKTRPRNVRVLLVEDNLVDAGLTIEAFRESEFPLEVTRVRDGEEAMAFLLREGNQAEAVLPDVILLDLDLPRKDGYWVLGQIRENPRLAHIPVIILTYLKNDEDSRRAYDHQADFYLVKPMDLNQLFEIVRYLEDVWFAPYRFERSLSR